MSSDTMPVGEFFCDITLQVIRAPEFTREERGGITYLVARGYEQAYETILRFTNCAELPVKGRIVGELNQMVVIRDARGKPVRRTGYVQGLTEISDAHGTGVIFRGRYYDPRVIVCLSGDEALTGAGLSVVEHRENGFGEGPYAGHAFSMGVLLTRTAINPLRGQGHGRID